MNRLRGIRRSWVLGSIVAFCLGVWPGGAWADPPRVFAPGQLPKDKRLGDLKTLNGYFPFSPPPSPEGWAKRAERVRRQLLVANGLWPMPTKTPANAVIHGPVDRDGYTVEKVYLESFPGHFVTGNLYRPKGRSGRLPGVLCPHGHWPNGRFYEASEKDLRRQIVEGAERFARGGRSPLQARCVQLARMGCVVFHYDMVGFADSVQLGHGARMRPEMCTAENWGFASPQAELWLQNPMGLQTYNSIRALDWFSELPDVDPKRIAVTGASGGGTQTFILCAVDPRPALAIPVVMVSTAMQGGCTCENACYLRVGTGNIEIAALIAPRPLGLIAADDWTKEIATKGLPELKQLYKMLGVEPLVMAKPLLHFPHNYNYVSRAVMYAWVNKYFGLGLEEPIVEEDFQPLSIAEMSVWDQQHPKPAGGPEYERSLLRWMTEDSRKQLDGLVPKDAASLSRFREIVGGAVDVMIGRSLPEPGSIQAAEARQQELGPYRLSALRLRYPAEEEEVPALLLKPAQWNKQAVIWISPAGKQALFTADGMPTPAVRKVLDAGMLVVGIDLFGQGEFTADGKPLAHARLVNKDYAGYTYGYNHPVFSQRVHDILSAICYLKQSDVRAEQVHLVGLSGAGRWVAAAKAQAGAAVDRVVVDTSGFRFAKLAAIDDPDFLPGGAKYLDLPGLLALGAPGRVWLAGEGPKPPALVAAAYQAAEAIDRLTVFAGEPSAQEQEAAAIDWLLK